MSEPRPVGLTMRWSRAWVLSLVALLTGVAAHVSAQGLLPATWVLALLVVLGTLVSAPLLGRRAPSYQVVGMLVAGQTAVHVVLAATAGHRNDPRIAAAPARHPLPPTPPAHLDRHGSYFDVAYAPHVNGSGAGLTIPAPVEHLVGDMTAHPAMAVAHLVAAALCGLWLAMGERALWRLVDLAARGVSASLARQLLGWYAVLTAAQVTATTALLAALTSRADTPERLRPIRLLLLRGLSRRGPPAPLAG